MGDDLNKKRIYVFSLLTVMFFTILSAFPQLVSAQEITNSKNKSYKYKLSFNYISTDIANLDASKELGFDWILTGWLGKSQKLGLPVYYKNDPKVAALREEHFPQIKKQIEKLAEFHRQAKARGLKVMLFSYEPSVPYELKEAYPEAFYPYPKEFTDRMPSKKGKKLMCIYDERTREWIANKVSETINNVWPIDAYMFTDSETMWGSGPINHICENCYDKPRWLAIKYLYEAVQEGVRRSGRDVKIVQRTWAFQHPDDYRANAKNYYEFLPYDKELQKVYMETVQAGERPYKGSRDYPLFIEYIKKQDSPWIQTKATCSDFLLHQPLNSYVGIGGEKVEEILELSLEPSYQKFYGFVPSVFLRQIQKHLQYGLDRGCDGVCILPIEPDADWGLNTANLDVGVQLIDNPYANVEELLSKWTEKRYGRAFEPWLIKAILSSEDITADIASYNGISHMMNFDIFRSPYEWLLGTSKAYLWPLLDVFPDRDERFDLTKKGFSKAVATWNKRVRQASEYNERVQSELGKLPQEARADVSQFFDRLAAIVLFNSLLDKLLYVKMALEFNKIEPSGAVMRLIERWEFQVYYIISSDKEIRDASFTNNVYLKHIKASGWQNPDLTEKDVFPEIGNDTEVLAGEQVNADEVLNDIIGRYGKKNKK